MNLDWRRLKAVVIESDDWGLCAWSADMQAFRVLADTPAFRHPSGRRYGGSTLESAADLRDMVALLGEFTGDDGIPPVIQANMIMASPDYGHLSPPLFDVDTLPLIDFPQAPSRWKRPGLDKAVKDAGVSGAWWPELHGLHHLPQHAWLTALRRGESDARRAHEQQSPVCGAVEPLGEYGASEPIDLRRENLRLAVEKFRRCFGRAPASFCPPDYHWDDRLDRDAAALGLHIFQGVAEAAGKRMPRIWRLFHRYRWPLFEGDRFMMPPRIAFEPIGSEGTSAALGAERTHRAARDAWNQGQPAVISTHRMNYVHLKPEWVEAGRAALRDLLARLRKDGAMFLVDFEVRALLELGWSMRPVGTEGAVFRYCGVPGETVRFNAPEGVKGVRIDPDVPGARIACEAGQVEARVNVGNYRLHWSHT